MNAAKPRRADRRQVHTQTAESLVLHTAEAAPDSLHAWVIRSPAIAAKIVLHLQRYRCARPGETVRALRAALLTRRLRASVPPAEHGRRAVLAQAEVGPTRPYAVSGGYSRPRGVFVKVTPGHDRPHNGRRTPPAAAAPSTD